MGRCYGMFKTEAQAIIAGTAGISLAGCAIATLWFASISHKLPSTMTPAWEKATAKYRAAQSASRVA